jgi:hypothetical protein
VDSGAQKLGHPQPLSYFVSEENSDAPHAAQWNIPSRRSK